MLFAVTDIETTGSAPSPRSITEVAVVLTDGEKILKEFQSLVNPERRIPNHITVLTGITDDMVADAPLFEEIAEELLSFFSEAVFVAHNVNFDYSHLKAGFEYAGFKFNRPKLCTVRYTRKMFPGLSSYSLGAVCKELDINNDNQHRAMSDTIMALQLLKKDLKKDKESAVLNEFLKRGNGDAFLPMNLKKETYHELPEDAGVYYFKDSTGKIIYVGKAKNIKKRVRQHFSGKMASRKKQAFMAEIFEIDFELTGTELIAALKEDQEIKHLWPKYNSAQKSQKKKFGVFEYEDRKGRKRLAVQNTTGNSSPLKSFNSAFVARQWLFDLREEFDLPHYRLSLPFSLAEDEEENVLEVNKKIEQAILELKSNQESFLIKGPGRKIDEDSVILIKESTYRGFGFIPKDTQITSVAEVEDHVNMVSHSDFCLSIIRSFMEKNIAGELIYFT